MRHILVVVDDPDICDVLRAAFELRGRCRLTCAMRPEAAMAAVDHDGPDAALIDAVLAGGSGLGLSRALIARGVSVAIMTGAPRQQEQLIKAGAHFLPKPFSITRALVEIEAVLERAADHNRQIAASLDRILRCGSNGGTVAPTGSSRDVLVDQLLAEAIAVTGAEMGNIQQILPGAGTLRIVASRGFTKPFLDFFALVRPDDRSACAAALKRAGRIVVSDVRQSPLFAANASGDALRQAQVRAVQSTPVFGRAGHLAGMISTHWTSVRQPGDSELARLDALVMQAAGSIEAA